jgi:hypothetical protein
VSSEAVLEAQNLERSRMKSDLGYLGYSEKPPDNYSTGLPKMIILRQSYKQFCRCLVEKTSRFEK